MQNNNAIFSTTPPRLTGWALIKTYWQSEHRFSAYFIFGIAVIMTVGLVAFDVVFNYWYNYFYTDLQEYNKSGVIHLLILFFILAGFYMALAVYRFYLSQLFGLRWRRWLTEQLIGRWLTNRAYYLIENFDPQTDNPDQRIQEDISSLVSNAIDLSLGLIAAFTTFFAFLYILWNLSGDLKIPLGHFGTIHISGYLVWVSIVYSLIGTYFTIKIGRPLVPLNFEQQRREATFRYAAVDLRSHAEHIALYRGEQHQGNVLNRLFASVLDNWYAIILRQRLLLWYTSGYNQTAVILPLLVALPNYFDKIFLIGGLIQTLGAFRSVQDSLSFIVNSYTQIASFQAVSQRLTTFINHMSDAEQSASTENELVFSTHADNNIVIKALSIKKPNGELLLKNINQTFPPNQHALIKGPSGLGKSTFIRTLAHIWPYAAGEIIFGEHQKIMYLPQKSYMPIGSLAEAIIFPDDNAADFKHQLAHVLKLCQLEPFIPRLNETAAWSEQLSPGEQQRIAFARVLLKKPNWIFLDESTSMLDMKSEIHLYQMLKRELPACTIVSIDHHANLDEFHDYIIDLSDNAVL